MLDINKLLFGHQFRLILLTAFIFIGALAAIDIIADMQEGAELIHIIIEGLLWAC